MSTKVSFSLENQDGEVVTDADFLGEKYIVYFYTRAMTPG